MCSDKDKRNAEPLPHIEHHAVFVCFLACFDKLYEEAENEDGGEAVAEIETWKEGGFVFLV